MASLLEHCQGLPRVQFAAGATVLAEGAAAGVLYVLTEGAVEIVKGDVQITAVAEPGALFGEISVLLGIPHMATVRALRESAFYVATDPAAFMRSHPTIAFEVAKLLSRRLQLVTGYLADLKRQFADRGDHLAMVDDILESLVHHQEAESDPGSERHPDPRLE
jgi:CRP-like cAMP-binding protein